MVLSFLEVTELKNAVKEKFSAVVHLHDCCAGQYFSLDIADEALKNYITLYFSEKNLRVLFSDDGLRFRVK